MALVKTRGFQVVNAKFDATGVADDVRFQQTSVPMAAKRRGRLYDPPTNSLDRSIKMGETAFERTKASYMPGTDEEAHVRTVLNGMTHPTRAPEAPPNGEDPADWKRTRTEIMMKELRGSIRFVGVALKDVAYDASRPDIPPSDAPVLAVSGHLTVTNTGEKHIRVGDAVEAYLVTPSASLNQYNDDVNMFSPNRAVVGYRPLVLERSFEKELESNPELQAAIRALVAKAAVAAKTQQTAEEAYAEFTEKLAKDPKHAKACDLLLYLVRTKTCDAIMSKYVGVATTSATQGSRFNIAIQPLPDLVSRARETAPSGA